MHHTKPKEQNMSDDKVASVSALVNALKDVNSDTFKDTCIEYVQETGATLNQYALLYVVLERCTQKLICELRESSKSRRRNQ